MWQMTCPRGGGQGVKLQNLLRNIRWYRSTLRADDVLELWRREGDMRQGKQEAQYRSRYRQPRKRIGEWQGDKQKKVR